jgi:hypothetical protein
MKLGDRGDDVRELQQRLTRAGWSVAANGAFDAITDTAVREYQAEFGLVVDGKVGPLTLASLRGEPPPSEPIVKLVDVSQWSGVPDYGVLRAKGYTGVIPRLGSGVDGVDKLAEKHITAARTAGLRVETGYVYVKSWEPGDKQARHFIDLADRFGLGLWPDVEPAKPYDPERHVWPVATDRPSLYRPVAVACFDALRASAVAWGVYGAMFLESLNLPAWLASRPLWAATYGEAVKVPRPWEDAAIWQHEGDVEVAGAKVDYNRVLAPGGMAAVIEAMRQTA